MLKSAKRPLIILGKGAAYAQADDAIRALVEKSGVPFLPMSMGKGLLPDTHPQCAGAARSTVLKDSDVVMLIGARLNWLLSHGKGKTWGEAPKKFIQIDIEPKEMDSNVEIVAPVVGDIGSCVAALLEGMGGNWPAPPADWIKTVNIEARRERRQDGAAADEQQRRRWTTTARSACCAPSSRSGRTPSWSTKAPTRSISRAASSTCISRASASTSAPGASWASAWAMPSPPRSRPASRCSRSKATRAFGFSGMEVETICRYKLPVCIVIFNNDGIYRGTDVNDGRLGPGADRVRQGLALRQDDRGLRRRRRQCDVARTSSSAP